MKPPHRPGGRSPYQRLSVIKMPDSARLVLGQSEPVTDDRRARAAAQWGAGSAAPRQSAPATIDVPLPPRVQTVLSYRLEPGLARQLTGGASPPPASRREAQRAVQATLVVGVDRIEVEATASGSVARPADTGCDE
jgi:hypothetical protein